MKVAIIGTSAFGLGGRGKMTKHFPRWFKPKDVECEWHETPETFSGADVAVLVYNEEREQSIREFNRLDLPNLVFNSVHCGRILGDKRATHAAYAEAGIPMPPLKTDGAIFSRATTGSKQPITLVSADEMDPGRYNTAYIDTTHEYRGERYYVCLRAMAVTGAMTALRVRARRVDGYPSVHAADTPRDPDLIRHLYETIALPRRDEIAAICAKAGEVLGPGFYCHDLLPGEDRTYVCESGIKFDDNSIRKQLWPIKSQLPWMADLFNGDESRLAAELFRRQILNWSTSWSTKN